MQYNESSNLNIIITVNSLLTDKGAVDQIQVSGMRMFSGSLMHHSILITRLLTGGNLIVASQCGPWHTRA